MAAGITLPDPCIVDAARTSTGDLALISDPLRSPIRVNSAVLVEGLDAALTKIRELEGLPPNWDSYQGLPPSRSALSRSYELIQALVNQSLPMPGVIAPTSKGGLQFEWSGPTGELEAELRPDGTCDLLLSRDSGDRELEDVSLSQVLSWLEETGVHAITGPN